MSKSRLPLMAMLLMLIGVFELSAQRVIAYHQGEKNALIQSWYWDYVTDVNYSFAQLNSQGGVNWGINGVFDQSKTNNFNAFKTLANSNGVKMHMSVGGASATQAKYFKQNVSSDAKAASLAQNLVSFATANGFVGIDIDWEPESDGHSDSPTAAEWTLLAKKLREAITATGQSLELSAAVFPFKWNNDYVTSSCYDYFDHLNLMVYDYGGDYEHHSDKMVDLRGWNDPAVNFNYSNMNVEEAAVRYWNEMKGLPTYKMVLGLPFYARGKNWQYQQNDYKLYRDVISSGGSANADTYGNWRYNGQQTISRKTNYALDNGLKGVMYWEWVGDATTEAKSLQATIDDIVGGGVCAKPNLGDDLNLCGKVSVELNANLSPADYTFVWFRDNVELVDTDLTLNADIPGTYRVEAVSINASCSKTDVVVVEGEIGDLPVFEDASLCGSTAYEADATIEGFEDMQYSWDNGTNGAVISINSPGTYTVTVSDPKDKCPSKSGGFTASENSVNVTVEDVCQGSDEAHYVIAGEGSYTWFDSESGGEFLGDESELYYPQANGPVWIQKTGGATSYTVGLAYDNEDPANEWSGPGNGGYRAWNDDDVRLRFEVLQNLTITQFSGRFSLNGGDPGSHDVVIYDEELNPYKTESIELAEEGYADIKVNFELTPGTYYLGMPTVWQWVQQNSSDDGDIGYGEFGGAPGAMDLDGVIDFVTTNSKEESSFAFDINYWYAGFYDIQVATGQVCPRVSAEAGIDPTICPKVNEKPVITTLDASEFSLTLGESTTVFWSANDAEDGDLTSSVVITGADGFSFGTSGSQSWEPTSAGSFVLTANVVDSEGADALSKSITIDVVDPSNENPEITKLTVTPTTVFIDEDVSISVEAEDSDGSIASYEITVDGTSYSSSTTTWSSSVAGTFTVIATVTDNDDATASATSTITVKERDIIVDPGESYELDYTDPLENCVINGGLPNNGGVTSDAGSSFESEDYLTSNGLELNSLSDVTDAAVIWFSLPDIDGEACSNLYGTENGVNMSSNGKITVTATGETGAVLQIFLGEGQWFPSTSTFNNGVDGGFVWVEHTFESNGEETFTYDFSTEADNTSEAGWSDWAGKSSVEQIGYRSATNGASFTIKEVILASSDGSDPVNQAPVVSFSASSYDLTLGESTDLEWSATDSEDGDLTSSVVITGVGGISFGSTGFKEWEPSSIGTFSLTATVEDSEGKSDTKTITIFVEEEVVVNEKPIITNFAASETELALGESTDIYWQATDAEDGDLTSSVVISGVDGASFGVSGDETWAPTSAGSFVLTADVVDSEGLAADSKSITIVVIDPENANPIIDGFTVTPTTVEIGEEVTIEVTASDTDGSISSYKIEVDGTIFNSSSAVWEASRAGSFTVQVTVYDDKGASASDSKTVVVEEEDVNPNPGAITLISPTDGEVINNPSTIVFDVDVVDASVTKVRYQLTGPAPDYMMTFIDGVEEDGYDGKFNPSVIGKYELQIHVYSNSTKLTTVSSEFSLTGEIVIDGLSSTLGGSEVIVYPVPADEFAIISFSPNAGGEATVELMDLHGALVSISSDNVSSGSALLQINVSDVPTGVYFARITLNGESVVKKMVVE